MITLYSHKKAPNGWKVAIVLEELGLKYETKFLEFGADEPGVKGPEHLKLNPNGRIPTIIDHDNNDFTLWESATIVRYLVDRYDKDHKLSFPAGSAESYLVDQWMTFQVSGQGPYFGQALWFKHRHPEKLPSAVDRYQKEIIRVVSVLDGVLAKQKYLVGDKMSIADISFYVWDYYLFFNPPDLLADSPYKEELMKYKNFLRWHEEVGQMETVKKLYEQRNSF